MNAHRRLSARGAVLAVALIGGLATTYAVRAEGLTKVVLTIENHRFTPTEVHIPAGKPWVLTVHNRDKTPEEFEFARSQDREGHRRRRHRHPADAAAGARPVSVRGRIS